MFCKPFSAYWKSLYSLSFKKKISKFGDSMNKKTIYAIVAVLVIIIVVAVAAVFLLGLGGGGPVTPTPTPTATPLTVVDANTLQFDVAETTDGVVLNYAFASKNVNTTEQVVRMDILGGEAGNFSYIIDIAAGTSFTSMDNGVTWTAGDFNTDLNYVVAFADYQTALVNWDGHSETYSFTTTDALAPPAGRGIVISSIHVNPTLDDATYFSTS